MSDRSGSGSDGTVREALSRPPDKTWPDGVLHHGSRILLLLAMALGLTLLFPPVARLNVTRYDLGTVVEEEIIAQVPFAVPKSSGDLEQDRNEAAAAVPPTFEYRPEAADSVVSRLEAFFQQVDSAAEVGESEVRALLSSSSISTSRRQAQLLTDTAGLDLLESTAIRATREILPQGVMDASQAQTLTTERITVRQEGEEERQVEREDLLSARDFYDRAVAMLPSSAAPDFSELLRLVLIRFMEPTYVLDPVATDQDKDAARRSVPTTKATILAGEAIVRGNQQVGEEELERLRAYEEHLRAQGLLEETGSSVKPFLGAILQALLLLGTFGLLLYFFRDEVYTEFRWVVLLGLLVTAYFVLAWVIARSESLPAETLPVGFVALAVAVLWDGRMAMVLGFVLAVLTGLLPPFQEVHLVALGVVGTAAAALGVRAVRRRVQAWVFGLAIGGAQVSLLLSLALVNGTPTMESLVGMAWTGGSGISAAVAAMALLPLLERFSGITTDQTLLEWADPNQELLKRLSLEAPGTYAHTIQVANLAEAAANAIDANGLLCRVGIYYHDVGKMLKPQYFVENQPGGRNPHDKLKPSTSATIVREHVTEGLRLAREARVPELVADFIPEHHGTQSIGFFLEKAREEGESEELDPEGFSYPGPKPRSRETAIAMLADSVESATRALKDPSPERIQNLIGRIVEGKIQDGQLDDAPLTLREIATIKDQFAKVLGGIYHHRLDYPATRDITEEAVEKDAVAAALGAEADGAEAEAEDAETGEAGRVEEERARTGTPEPEGEGAGEER